MLSILPERLWLKLCRRFPFVRQSAEKWLEREAGFAESWIQRVYRQLITVQWKMLPVPEHFDHRIDLFYQWLNNRNPNWVERGVFSGLALRGGTMLELACGEGFNSRNFYSLRCRSVLACDFNRDAIAMAKRKNAAPNITYQVADIRTALPEGIFDNIVFDGAIEHFTEPEIFGLVKKLKTRLAPGGIFSGYTIVERTDGKQLPQHEYEFKSKEDLQRFLTPSFRNVTVFETLYPDRHNLYFWASDSVLPFSADWRHWSTVAAAKQASL